MVFPCRLTADCERHDIKNKTLWTHTLRCPSDLGMMLMLALGPVLGPALVVDLIALLHAKAF
jgi:hypothetical protein